MSAEKKVRKNTTSCAVRNRWNSAHYDRINITVPKGYGDMFKDYCEERKTTMNSTLSSIIDLEIAMASEEEKKKNVVEENAEKV